MTDRIPASPVSGRLAFANDEMRCNQCDKQTPHRLFGDTWRCSECGGASSICAQPASGPVSGETIAELEKALDGFEKALRDDWGEDDRSHSGSRVNEMTQTEKSTTPEQALYEKLSEAATLFTTLRQEPYFSTKDLDELVTLAANARDNANWLRAQRDVAESRVERLKADSLTAEEGRLLVSLLIEPAFDESAEFYTESIRRAAKPYRCCECRAVILKGEQHEYVSGKWDGAIMDFRTCLACAEIRKVFCCQAWILETLWEEMREQIFPKWQRDELAIVDCLARLKTDRATDKTRTMYAEYQADRESYV